jgi:hypothetical protein
MKKITVILVLLAFSLAGCSAASTQSGAQGSGNLNPMSELIIGSLKLDGTANAITRDQAKELLPLWQVYKQLMTSDSAAQAEIDGLGSQIKDTLTSGQRKAISDMKLSQSDAFTYMQSQGGASTGSTGGQGASSNSSRNSGAGGFPGGDLGGMPPGGMPDAGGFPGGGMPGGTSSRQATGTQTANTGRAGNMDRVPTPLIDALIQYLQKTRAS